MLREAWLPLVVLVALGVAPLLGFGGSYETTLMARAMILGMAAVSLSFLVGGAGLVSLGHAASVGVGAYAVAILDAHGVTEATLVLPAAIGAAALFSLLTGAIAIRTSGVHFIMITLAFGQMAFFTASSLAAYGGDDGYTLYSRTELLGTRLLENRLAFHYICLGLLAASWGGCAMLLASRFGRVLRAARENPQRVEAVGLAPYPFRLLGYMLAGAMGGLAGVLLANATEFVSPATLSWQRSGELLFMVILGGAGRLWGAILGALAFVLLETWLAQQMLHWKLVFGPLLVLAVIFLRGGLSGLVARHHG
ncbi:branched-chain amino acid ABC transporter permease [Roseomonas eburnea]|uniref:Branched-chain amino acid ABC transporter permease n=1 Tax=Neoroseomonas eburnea TaxID=1346889 RepID=A0A9X9XHD6_9PROT|nr:branched-chain amino acid ABC transporter permease [Neoroseomonas eburnea]MBR0683122.1 branched-chain amino acid ABC transporter permease [Neoroseomonas eburnea]